MTVWGRYRNHCEDNLDFKSWLQATYHDIRITWTKQFIYIQRLDKNLTRASDLLPYPKPANEFPICTKIEIWKQDDDYFNGYHRPAREEVHYKYEKEEQLFTTRTLERRGEMPRQMDVYAVYDKNGDLDMVTHSIDEIMEFHLELLRKGIRNSINTGKAYKNFFIKKYEDDNFPDSIEVDYVATIDGQKFLSQSDMARFLGVSRQAISQSKQRNSKIINGYNIE